MNLAEACTIGNLERVKELISSKDYDDWTLKLVSEYSYLDLEDYYAHLEIVEYLRLVKFLKILSKLWKERQKFKRIKE